MQRALKRLRNASPARVWWYIYHRQMRICRREIDKMVFDVMMYGSGAYRIGPEVPDLIEHVKFGEFSE